MPNCRCVKSNSLVLALVVFAIATLAVGAADRGIVLKTDSFDRNPHWEGFNNRLTPKVIPTITQDFGFSESHFAGRTRGEIGGKVWRATAPAYHADKIPARTLDEPLHASDTFALTELSGSSGAFFGWFNAVNPAVAAR
jgi:hypothetical protein